MKYLFGSLLIIGGMGMLISSQREFIKFNKIKMEELDNYNTFMKKLRRIRTTAILMVIMGIGNSIFEFIQ